MKKYDVGIYGLWYGRNYGSILTYYALQNVVKGLGYSCVFIRNPIANEPSDLSTLVRSHPMRFAADHYDMSEQYSFEEMSKHNEICDRFLLGSDQMWRYELSFRYQFSYFFDFADSKSVKVAYGTSFGNKMYTAPDEYKKAARKYLEAFDGISLRDNVSKEILKRDFGIDAVDVLDPVFLCPVEKYDDLVKEAQDFKIDEKYVFAYILDPDPMIGESLSKIAAEQNLKIFVAFDELGDKKAYFDALRVDTDRVIGMGDLTPSEWLYMFKNAELVLTNSFHGTCFSIIYERPFFALVNEVRGADRFVHLLNQFDLQDRLTVSPDQLFDKFKEYSFAQIDYKKAFETAESHKAFSIKWLRDALYGQNVCGKQNCVGCGACVSACPKECISLSPDKHGFYRATIDSDKCVRCGICKKTCPVLNKTEKNEPPCLYEAISIASEDVMKSSSGGVFPILARRVFDKQGVVVGAAWKDDLTVEHIVAENEEELEKIRKSKYLQSYIGNIFKKVKSYLESGRLVLFSGCPCQCAGLRSYLKKDYKNLIIVDILCATAPSAGFFKKYLEDEYGNDIESYTFRYKDEGQKWNCFTTKATLKSGQNIIKTTRAEDNYQRAFHSHTMTPVHCQNCEFQGRRRYGDITLGDFWGIEKNDPEVKDSLGVSALAVSTSKGAKFLKSISEKCFKVFKKVPIEWIGGNGFMANNKNFVSPYRDAFFDEILHKSFSQALNDSLASNQTSLLKASDSLNPLQFVAHAKYFDFESDIWEETIVGGCPTLKVIKANPGFGHYASMPLHNVLKAGKKYQLFVRFRFNTSCPVINFHVKASNSKNHQVVYTYHNSMLNKTSDFVEFQCEFVANAASYDEFMLGAAHFVGDDNFISFASMHIVEKNS